MKNAPFCGAFFISVIAFLVDAAISPELDRYEYPRIAALNQQCQSIA